MTSNCFRNTDFPFKVIMSSNTFKLDIPNIKKFQLEWRWVFGSQDKRDFRKRTICSLVRCMHDYMCGSAICMTACLFDYEYNRRHKCIAKQR